MSFARKKLCEPERPWTFSKRPNSERLPVCRKELWRSNSQRKPQPRPTATQEFEQYLRKASKICGAFPDEDAAKKGDVPGTPQPGKKMKRRPGKMNTIN
jgi:hypothetical protein